MNRDDFIDLLARLVSDGELSEAEAADLLHQFDAGTLSDSWQLPLPIRDAIRRRDERNVEKALAILLAFLRTKRLELRPLPQMAARRLADGLQAHFEANMDSFASRLADGIIDLPTWQRRALDEVERHTIEQMMLGNGSSTLTKAQLSRLDTIMVEQGAFLQRFADHMALSAGEGEPWSEQRIAARSRAYGGVGRAEFFRAWEVAGVARGDIESGAKVWYVSQDDRSTCGPCLDAERGSPYAIGSPYPRPGEICLGRGACRCVLEYR